MLPEANPPFIFSSEGQAEPERPARPDIVEVVIDAVGTVFLIFLILGAGDVADLELGLEVHAGDADALAPDEIQVEARIFVDVRQQRGPAAGQALARIAR